MKIQKDANAFPRTLLLTWWRPDGRYAGAETLRRILSLLPADRICWATLRAARGPLPPGLPEHRAFPPRGVHWRLRDTVADCLYVHDWQSRRLAADISGWAAGLDPELIWVLPELAMVNVAYGVHRRLRVPVHATVYDAHWFAGEVCVPRLYMPLYLAAARRLLRAAGSFDAVCPELVDHVRRRLGPDRRPAAMGFPPSVPRAWMAGGATVPAEPGRRLRRLGFCGGFRVSREQWTAFLTSLGRLPFDFVVETVAADAAFADVPVPGNVRLAGRPYFPDESELVRFFRDGGFHACYLGLWKDGRRARFGRTSLSSKLATYAAAGVPVIVDGPADSVAWRLVGEYDAGVLWGEGGESGRIFADPAVWRRKAEGAAPRRRGGRDEGRGGKTAERLVRGGGVPSAGGYRGISAALRHGDVEPGI